MGNSWGVAEAGGKAHLATFARLEVTSSPAVRDSFPVLLAHGVPEEVLLAILAPVPPQAPMQAISQLRSDVPERRASTRASMTAALEAMDPSRREETMAAIDANLLAQSTRRSLESRVRMLTTLAERGNFQLFPLDVQKLQLLAGALRIGGYRSAGLYLDAALWHQEHRLRSPVSADLRRAARSLTKAALRGLPGSRLKQAFDLADLATLVEHDAVAGSLDMDILPHAVDVLVVATWFMLREIEIAGARVKDIEVTAATVSLDIPLHKTARPGSRCAPDAPPTDTSAALTGPSRELTSSQAPAGSRGRNWRPPGSSTWSCPTDGAGHKRFVFGGHAARVAGATFLALRGVPVAVIQLIGAVDFSAEVAAIDFVPAPVAAERAVIPAATTTHYVMNCRTRLLHKPAAEEADTERAEWQARCGWPYGVRQFFRLHDLPPNPSMCRRCFPDTPVDLEAPEAVSSSDSSSSTSGATSESD